MLPQQLSYVLVEEMLSSENILLTFAVGNRIGVGATGRGATLASPPVRGGAGGGGKICSAGLCIKTLLGGTAGSGTGEGAGGL